MLEGQPNFRDLGGYRTAKGRSVVAGRLFRSGELSALTDADLARLVELGIRTVVDLRSEMEATMRPDRLPPSVSYRAVRMLPAVSASAMEELISTGDFRSFPSWETIYRSAIRDHAAAFAALIRLAADARNRPLVFHCTTGKDRTGLAAALLLSLLGVSWTDVEADYLRSNEYVGMQRAAMVERIAEEMSRTGRFFEESDRRQLERMFLVDVDYLAAARDEMTALNGSVGGYLAGSLGIERQLAESIRAQLLL